MRYRWCMKRRKNPDCHQCNPVTVAALNSVLHKLRRTNHERLHALRYFRSRVTVLLPDGSPVFRWSQEGRTFHPEGLLAEEGINKQLPKKFVWSACSVTSGNAVNQSRRWTCLTCAQQFQFMTSACASQHCALPACSAKVCKKLHGIELSSVFLIS